MRDARLLLILTVPSILAALACSSRGGLSVAGDAAMACPARFSASDTGQPSTITVDTSAVVNSFRAQAPLRRQQRVFHHAARFDEDTSQGAGGGKLLHPLSRADRRPTTITGTAPVATTKSLLGSQPDDLHAGLSKEPRPTGARPRVATDVALVTDGDPSTRWLSNVDTAFPDGSMGLRRPRRGQVAGLDPDRVGHALRDVVSDPDVVVFTIDLSSALPGVRGNLGEHFGRHRHGHWRHADRGLRPRIGRGSFASS
jgi:hypothetical protein